MEHLCAALYALVEADQPMTVRHVFYRAVAAGLIEKTDAEYKTTICRLLANMRTSGEMPYAWITDNTRLMRKPASYGGLEEMLSDTARVYRRDIWRHLDTYVEVWCEKDALSGVLYDVTAPWDVPLMVTRGYPSLSFLQGAAQALSTMKRNVIYYIGDWDPSGLDIRRNVEQKLRLHAPDADLTFTALAVKAEQIAQYNLTTRPTKATDSRARHFEGESVEADAIPAPALRNLTERAIEQHVDHRVRDSLRVIEADERCILSRLAVDLGG